jgi:hypothetical protein
LFVDSHVTIAARKNSYKQQIAEMEKAAKAAFSFAERYENLRAET